MSTWPNRPVDWYLTALTDPDWRVRRQAAAAFEVLGDKRAVSPLVSALNDEHPKVRWSAVRALGKLGGAEVVKPLIAVLHDSDDEVRCQAMDVLGQLRHPQVLAPLIAALHDPSLKVRNHATKVLASVGDVSIVPHLMALLIDEQASAHLDALAPGAAGGVPADADFFHAFALVQPLAAALRRFADAALPRLMAALDDPRPRIRARLVVTLGAIGDDRAAAALTRALQDPDPLVRQRAAGALARLRIRPVPLPPADPLADLAAFPPEFRAVFEQITEGYAAAGRPYEESFAGLRRWFQEQLLADVRRAYQAAGSPYGEDQDGMLRWWDEQKQAIDRQEFVEWLSQQLGDGNPEDRHWR